MSKDIRMRITVRNNLLLEAIEKAGYRSVAAFCKANEIGYTAMCSLVGMKTSPLIWAKSPDGTAFSQWNPLVIQVALALEVDETDLFSRLILEAKPLKKNSRSVYCSSETSQMWMTGRSGQNQLPADEAVFSGELKDGFESLLKTLTPREEVVLRARFGLDGDKKTLEELGRMFNVSRERICQIERKAIRKMRHPTRANKLRQFLPLHSKHYDEEMPT